MKKPYFPMFVDLSGRQVTVVGGGSVALRRSETLLYFGVDIKVIAPEIRRRMQKPMLQNMPMARPSSYVRIG